MSYSSIPVYWSSLSLSVAHPFSYGLWISLPSHPYSLSTLSFPFPLLLSIWLAPSVLPLNRLSISIFLALCLCVCLALFLCVFRSVCVSLWPIGLCLVRCLYLVPRSMFVSVLLCLCVFHSLLILHLCTSWAESTYLQFNYNFYGPKIRSDVSL